MPCLQQRGAGFFGVEVGADFANQMGLSDRLGEGRHPLGEDTNCGVSGCGPWGRDVADFRGAGPRLGNGGERKRRDRRGKPGSRRRFSFAIVSPMDPLSKTFSFLRPRSYVTAGFDAGGD